MFSEVAAALDGADGGADHPRAPGPHRRRRAAQRRAAGPAAAHLGAGIRGAGAGRPRRAGRRRRAGSGLRGRRLRDPRLRRPARRHPPDDPGHRQRRLPRRRAGLPPRRRVDRAGGRDPVAARAGARPVVEDRRGDRLRGVRARAAGGRHPRRPADAARTRPRREPRRLGSAASTGASTCTSGRPTQSTCDLSRPAPRARPHPARPVPRPGRPQRPAVGGPRARRLRPGRLPGGRAAARDQDRPRPAARGRRRRAVLVGLRAVHARRRGRSRRRSSRSTSCCAWWPATRTTSRWP